MINFFFVFIGACHTFGVIIYLTVMDIVRTSGAIDEWPNTDKEYFQAFVNKGLEKYFQKNTCSVSRDLMKMSMKDALFGEALSNFLEIYVDGNLLRPGVPLNGNAKKVTLNDWEDFKNISWSSEN